MILKFALFLIVLVCYNTANIFTNINFRLIITIAKLAKINRTRKCCKLLCIYSIIGQSDRHGSMLFRIYYHDIGFSKHVYLVG